MGIFSSPPPMLSREELKLKVPNLLLNGEDKLTDHQWDRLKGLIEAYMDKDSHDSPYGGMTKKELDELVSNLTKYKDSYHFSSKNIEKVESALGHYIK